MIALAYSEDLGKVGTDKVAGHVLIGYLMICILSSISVKI